MQDCVVPEDVAFVGFDDLPFASLSDFKSNHRAPTDHSIWCQSRGHLDRLDRKRDQAIPANYYGNRAGHP